MTRQDVIDFFKEMKEVCKNVEGTSCVRCPLYSTRTKTGCIMTDLDLRWNDCPCDWYVREEEEFK